MSRDDFQGSNFTVDDFLFDNHRFTSLDVLVKDLEALFQQLNAELLNIVNNDFDEFIKLGKSIDGGMELISGILHELKLFNKACSATKSKMMNSLESTEKSLQAKLQLVQIKNNVKLCILLTLQLDNFEQLLEYDDPKRDLCNHIKSLTTIYLLVNKLWRILSNSDSAYVASLKVKVVNLGLEYKHYLLEVAKKSPEDGEVMLQLMRVFSVIDSEGELLYQLSRQ